MARIRSAKPEWWTDPRITALQRVIRWTFKGLWEVCADDEGRFLADPRVIKGQLWPMDDDLTARQIEKHLVTLAEAERICLYVVDGIRYGLVVNFLKHQKISHPTPSRLPAPSLNGLANHAGETPEALRNGSGKAPERLRPERSGAERDVDFDLDAERSGAERSSPPAAAPTDPPASAPPADAGSEKSADNGAERPRRQPILEVNALTLAHRMPEAKVQDGLEQLRATLTAQGARLRRGEYVRAYSPAHLEWASKAVLDSPPDKPEQLARWVLLKLRDTFTEWRARDEKHDAERIAPAIATIVRQAAPKPIDELEASRAWLAEFTDVAKSIDREGAEKFAEFPDTPAMRRKRFDWQDRQGIVAWKLAGSPVVEASR